MQKRTQNTTLSAEDVKLIDKLKRSLFATHGTVSTAALIRMALRKMEQEQK